MFSVLGTYPASGIKENLSKTLFVSLYGFSLQSNAWFLGGHFPIPASVIRKVVSCRLSNSTVGLVL